MQLSNREAYEMAADIINQVERLMLDSGDLARLEALRAERADLVLVRDLAAKRLAAERLAAEAALEPAPDPAPDPEQLSGLSRGLPPLSQVNDPAEVEVADNQAIWSGELRKA